MLRRSAGETFYAFPPRGGKHYEKLSSKLYQATPAAM